MRSRTSIVEGLHVILDILKSGEPYTLNKLAKESNLNFRTVKKILEVLQSSQTSFSGKQLEVSDLDNVTIVQLKEKTGLALYPEPIQNLIIRTNHYPTVSREEEILVYLFLKNALDVSTAIPLPKDITLHELVEAEHVGKIGNKFYLTEDGQYIAKGALEIYPELRKIANDQISIHVQTHEKLLVQWPKFPPPNILVAKQRSEMIQQ